MKLCLFLIIYVIVIETKTEKTFLFVRIQFKNHEELAKSPSDRHHVHAHFAPKLIVSIKSDLAEISAIKPCT